MVEGGAAINPSGSAGALALPDLGSPGLSMGFTLPHDYQANTPLPLVILGETPVTQCNLTRAELWPSTTDARS